MPSGALLRNPFYYNTARNPKPQALISGYSQSSKAGGLFRKSRSLSLQMRAIRLHLQLQEGLSAGRSLRKGRLCWNLPHPRLKKRQICQHMQSMPSGRKKKHAGKQKTLRCGRWPALMRQSWKGVLFVQPPLHVKKDGRSNPRGPQGHPPVLPLKNRLGASPPTSRRICRFACT